MSNIPWNPAVEAKFKTALIKMPFFHRRIAEKLVKDRAEELTRDKGKPEVSEEELVLAFFKEVPGPFKGMMKGLLTEAEIDYKKYVQE